MSIDAATQIVLTGSPSPELVVAGEILQQALAAATGVLAGLRRGVSEENKSNTILLQVVEGLVLADETGATPRRELGDQGYRIVIDPTGVTVTAASTVGLYYGVQTLAQIIKASGRSWRCTEIVDWPALTTRGVVLDASRGKIPTMRVLRDLVTTLASYKINHFQLYIEHTFAFPSHPDIGAGSSPFNAHDILALDALCRHHHIELAANLQSFGHHRRLLSLPAYAFLDEAGLRWTLSPAREETYRLLDDLYRDFLPQFSSSWLNVDCDETWDLGLGQSKSLVAQLGLGRVYLNHIKRLRELAARYGKRVMLWADVLHNHTELLNEVPEDLLLLDWSYEAQERYETTAVLERSGRPFWICPGTSSWNTLFPRVTNALRNIRTFTRDGLAAGATGMLVTDWGDNGHYQPLSNSWYPYLFAAATSWTGAATEEQDFDRAFSVQFLRQSYPSAAVSAVKQLGDAVAAPGLGVPNLSLAVYALWDDPLKAHYLVDLDEVAFLRLRNEARAAEAAWASLEPPSLRHDYLFDVRLIEFAIEKALLGKRLRGALVSTATPEHRIDAGQRLATLQAELATLGSKLPALKAEFEQRWLVHSRRAEIDINLDRFDNLAGRIDYAVAWLRDQEQRLQTGLSVDASLESYDLKDYAVLYDAEMRSLRAFAREIGPDNLPPILRSWLEFA